MAHYVKFMKGTPTAYKNLAKRDADTLYFISEADGSNVVLYLGDKVIAGSDENGVSLKLSDLTDVLISEGLADSAFLVYDTEESKWVNKSLTELEFTGATDLSAGISGLVPAPEIGQSEYFLRGDGTWQPVEVSGSETVIYQGELEGEETPDDLIVRLTEGKELNVGDMVLFHMGEVRVAYVYNGTEWVSLVQDVFNILVNFDEKFTSLVSDEESLEYQDQSVLRLRNWGKQYHKFNPDTKNYDLQTVDEEHPWIPGLEPRVDENGILAWYEPNPTIVDGLNDQITALDGRVDVVEATTTALGTRLDDAETAIAARYTKTETDTKIAGAVATADHLKRVIVEEGITEPEQILNPDENTIYMIPSGLVVDDNKYYEWMYLNETWEQVGSWEVDLSNYVQKKEGYDLISDEDIAKLNSIDNKAQKNYISSVESNFNVTDDGELSLQSIPDEIDLSKNSTVVNLSSSVSNLDNLINNSETGVIKQVQNLNTNVQNIETTISSLEDVYVTQELYRTQVGNLDNLIHASGNQDSSLVDEINNINTRLEWQVLK